MIPRSGINNYKSLISTFILKSLNCFFCAIQ
jgi:hypothetical protein